MTSSYGAVTCAIHHARPSVPARHIMTAARLTQCSSRIIHTFTVRPYTNIKNETQFSCSSQEYHHDETGIPAISHHTQCIVPAPYFFKTQCSSYTNTMRPGAGQWSSNSHTLCYHIPAAKQHQHETQECTNRSHINITSQDLG